MYLSRIFMYDSAICGAKIIWMIHMIHGRIARPMPIHA